MKNSCVCCNASIGSTSRAAPNIPPSEAQESSVSAHSNLWLTFPTLTLSVCAPVWITRFERVMSPRVQCKHVGSVTLVFFVFLFRLYSRGNSDGRIITLASVVSITLYRRCQLRPNVFWILINPVEFPSFSTSKHSTTKSRRVGEKVWLATHPFFYETFSFWGVLLIIWAKQDIVSSDGKTAWRPFLGGYCLQPGWHAHRLLHPAPGDTVHQGWSETLSKLITTHVSWYKHTNGNLFISLEIQLSIK